MKARHVILVKSAALLLLVSNPSAPVYAKSGGSTAAALLLIDPGARSKALAGAQVAFHEGLDAAYWNPAVLAKFTKKEIAVSYLRYFLGENINYGNISLAMPTRSLGTFGLRTALLDSGDIDRTDLNGLRTGTFRTQDAVLGPQWAVRIGSHLSFGVSGQYIRQTVDSIPVNGYAFDAGLLLTFWKDRLNFGSGVKNIGGEIRSRPIPGAALAGFACRPLQNLTLAGQVDYGLNSPIIGRFGLEYTFLQKVSARTGYRYEPDSLSNLSFGFGLALKNAMRIDYAFLLNQHKALDNSNQLSISYMFGSVVKTRMIQLWHPGERDGRGVFRQGEVVAVLNLKDRGVTENEAKMISDMMQTALVRRKIFKVVEGKKVESISQEEWHHLEECNEIHCAVKLGTLLNASKVFIGSVGRLGRLIVVTVQAVDVKSGEVVYADKTDSASIENIDTAVSELAKNISRSVSSYDWSDKYESKSLRARRNLPYKRWEIDVSGSYPYTLADYRGAQVWPSYGFSAQVGYNSRSWLQLGLEGGLTIMNFVTSSRMYTFSYSSYDQTSTNVRHIYVLPRMKLQGYVGKYIQPFVAVGAGYYNRLTATKNWLLINYWKVGETTLIEGGDTETVHGFGTHTECGINIGPRNSMLKVNLKGKFEWVFAPVRNKTMSNSMFSPSLGIVLSF